jgi:transposase
MTDIVRGYVGIDWATQAHQVCALDAAGDVLWERSVPHSGLGLGDLGDWLMELAAGSPATVWVSIEVPHGAVVETLLERGFTVFSINPKQLDRFRDRFSVAGAKDDRLDARVLAASLRTDTTLFRRLRIEEPIVIELREWSRLADELKQEQTRLANRFREQLRRYFPQALDVTGDITEPWFLNLWLHVPTPQAARRVREASVRAILKAHRIRRINAAEVLSRLRQPPLVVAPGTAEAAEAYLQMLLPRLRLVNRQIGQCERRLDELLRMMEEAPADEPGQISEQRDAAILRSLPGVGRVVLATLLSEASQPLKQRDYHTLRALCGVAPVTKQSGKRRIVTRRMACHPRLREAVYHWARVASQHDPLCREKYAAFRARGHSHGGGLGGLGDRLLYVACVLLQKGDLFAPVYRGEGNHDEAA